ncbi:hypothetical protein HAX54_048414 [Datura stramonium]|uniref:Transmembrane protein n=1 Tax=Datura stramonium TaxID=4076 RepID=A0ABS8STP6_DATST|nr:hypothetical protein [Datura stramonium]
MANNSRIGLFLLQERRTFTNQFNSTFMVTQSYIYYMYEEESSTTTCSLPILGFFFTILLNFLQLKYQGNDKTDPFSTHPKTMRVSVTSLLVYCLIFGIKQRFSCHPLYRKFSDLVHHVIAFFSSLSLASTVSVLFPDSVSPLVYFLCFLVFGGEMLLWVFKKIMQHFEEEEEESSYFQRRRAGGPVWNYLRRRMNMALYPMERRFTLPM